MLPVLVHQLGVTVEIARCEQLAAAVAELLGAVQVLEHLRVARLGALVLVAQHLRRGACFAGVEQQQVIAQAAEHIWIELERLDLDASVGVERVRADAAVSRHVGVLLADRLAEHVDLDLARRLGQRARR